MNHENFDLPDSMTAHEALRALEDLNERNETFSPSSVEKFARERIAAGRLFKEVPVFEMPRPLNIKPVSEILMLDAFSLALEIQGDALVKLTSNKIGNLPFSNEGQFILRRLDVFEYENES